MTETSPDLFFSRVLRGAERLGYVEGENLVSTASPARGHERRILEVATAPSGPRPDVIFAFSSEW